MPKADSNPAPAPDWRPAAKAVLTAIAAVALVFWSMLTSERFLPSPEVLWLQLLLSACAATAAIGTFLALQRSFQIGPPSLLGSRDTAPLSALHAAFVFVFLYLFLPALLPLLHRFAASQPVVVIEPVQTEGGGRRGCRERATLSGDSLWMRRRLCRLDDARYAELAATGRIEITGTRSYFGIQVNEFKAAPALDENAAQNP